MRYRARYIRSLNRLRHVETCVAAIRKPPARKVRSSPAPSSKEAPAAKNQRADVGVGSGGRRTLWQRPR